MPWLLLSPALVLLLAIYAWPVARILWLSFDSQHGFLGQYLELLNDPVVMNVLVTTIGLALEVTALCLILGYPIAYLMLRSSRRLKGVIATLIILPVWISVLVRAYAWIVILGRRGLLNQILQSSSLTSDPIPLLYNRFSMFVGLVHILLPFIVLPIYSVMQRVDLDTVKAARSLGAGGVAAFVWVFLPLSLPGVISGSLLVFIMSLGIFIIPVLLGGLSDITFVMLIEKQVDELLNWERASAMAGLLLVVTLALVVTYQKFLGSDTNLEIAGGSAGAPWVLRRFSTLLVIWTRVFGNLLGTRATGKPTVSRLDFSRWVGRWLLPAYSWSILGFLLLPIVILFPLAFSDSPFLEFPPPGFSLRWFRSYFDRADWTDPTLISIEVALITMLIATPLGVLAAIALARAKFWGKSLIEGFLLSPLIVPTMIIAMSMYAQFAGLGLIGTRTGLVLGHLVLATPFVVTVVAAALRATDESFERAARSLGAHPISAFLRVTLPMIRPAVLTASFFAFLASFDDLLIALFISGTAAKTLPKRIWEAVRQEVDPTTAAVSALLVTLSLALLLFVEIVRLRNRRAVNGDST